MQQTAVPLADSEYHQFAELLLRLTGIRLGPTKKALVCGRLERRLRHHRLRSYGDYLRLLRGGNDHELQVAVDLLTTNETYFFREPPHFEYLRTQLLPRYRAARRFRVWSAACSGGDEPYSVAMLLSDVLETVPWEVMGSDVSTRMLEQAERGHYPLARARHIPEPYLRRFCRRGVRQQDGSFIVVPELRSRVRFCQINLHQPLPSLGPFDVVMLRNVMIYFDLDVKRELLRRLIPLIEPGGHLFIGHSENLQGVTSELRQVAPSIFVRN